MITVTCRYTSLQDVGSIFSEEVYKEMITPFSYEFDVIPEELYMVLGVLTRLSTPWLYVSLLDGNKEIQLIPAILFDFTWSTIPEDWAIRIDNKDHNSIEILPRKITEIPNWFERYIDDDQEVVDLVINEINKHSECII